jgi:Flp pilus assembly pilin Flp
MAKRGMRFGGHLLRDRNGSAAIEYGLLAAAIGLGIVAALVSTKTSMNGTYSRIASGAGAASLAVPRCAVSGCADMSKPVSFAASNPNLANILTSGWSIPEPGSTWATGGTSVMTLDLGNLINSGAQSAQMDISANALRANFQCGNPNPCVPVTMAISVNGVAVGSMIYQPNSTGGNLGIPITQTVTLNQAALQAVANNNGNAVVTLNVDNHATPASLLPGYGDTRDLSVYVQNVNVR